MADERKKLTLEISVPSREKIYNYVLDSVTKSYPEYEFKIEERKDEEFFIYEGLPVKGKLLKEGDIVEFILNDPSHKDKIMEGEAKLYSVKMPEEEEYEEIELTPYHLFEDQNSLPLISYTEVQLQDAFLVKLDERFELGKIYWLNGHEVLCLRFIDDKALFVEVTNAPA